MINYGTTTLAMQLVPEYIIYQLAHNLLHLFY